MSFSRDRDLGMYRRITRRDFLDGARIALTGALFGGLASPAAAGTGRRGAFQPERDPAYYPPALTGMRGSHDGSFEVAHALKDDPAFDPGPVRDTGEKHDLVVVGGGLSGLAAAYFFRRAAGAKARVLVLDNHDDFGGHAKRNEFRHGGRLLIGYGGTQSIDEPSSYSPEAAGLLRELGIDVQRFYTAFDQQLYKSLGLTRAVFFDRETFGADRLVTGEGSRPWPEFLAEAPLSERARRDVARLYVERIDYLPDLPAEAKKARLERTSYRDFLVELAGVAAEALPFFQALTHSFWALGIDAVPALEAWKWGYPGFQGMGLGDGEGGQREPYIFHFPDGNASVARLLVRALVPEAVPGGTMEDVVTARADYARLDRPGQRVRIRLNSTVVRVEHEGPPATARQVSVTYVRGGEACRVRAGACVLACYHSIIPRLCPEMPEEQKRDLAYATRAPLVYTNVLIRDWTAFRKLGAHSVYAPGGFHSSFALDFPVSLGEYRFPSSPDEPMVVHMVRAPVSPGKPAREQHRAGRWDLLSTSFETFERRIRAQLGRALSGGGFDPARDILAITVNRWPHGYAYEYNRLFDPDWAEDERPWVRGRRRFGRIAIAGTDAAADAYTDAAIDQAHRAVRELSG
jgi:spermidine dehydrogenase